ncbi:hypothetical protein JEQ12_012359 [Ovis aries]|uniref:Uncharacterized protein n=1 Tax=Ovis aries TaxID=9940 RepID=A0A836CQG0_SHEEP|nr:hypothetical protein JEQ12_012359 [Ovis aries]
MGLIFRLIAFHTCCCHTGRKSQAIVHLIFTITALGVITHCFIHQSRTIKIIQCEVNVQGISLNKRTGLDFIDYILKNKPNPAEQQFYIARKQLSLIKLPDVPLNNSNRKIQTFNDSKQKTVVASLTTIILTSN